MNVPFFRYEFDPEALAAIEECLRSGWLTTGPKTKEFEKRFAEAVSNGETIHAVAVNSCTAALHLALEAVGVKRGDLVVVPTMTFAATAEVVRYFDAIPVFVDADPVTLSLSTLHLEEVMKTIADGGKVPGPVTRGRRLRAVIPVHYGGRPCDLGKVNVLAARYGCDVIEDAAHAFPAAFSENGSLKKIGGGTSRITCFSFYANKTITTGEGGMATTTEPLLAERMRLMSLHGMDRDPWNRYAKSGTWDYRLVAPGFKYNLTDIASAIGLSQLEKAERFRAARQAIAERYDRFFADLEEIETPPRSDDVVDAHHLYVIKLRPAAMAIDRARFIEEMRARGVVCSVHWRPLHMHPYYVETYGYAPGDYPQAAAAWERIVSLPLFPSMTEEEIEVVITAVQEVVRRFRSKGR
ncbi:MAG: DegT/DnrJ/EryC1/StrS family aminotransferase [Bacteroidota bacterium]|nr:DegT/DnrJ/EryC1/StrS family aminotransferase [Bacteroidota bacterium]